MSESSDGGNQTSPRYKSQPVNYRLKEAVYQPMRHTRKETRQVVCIDDNDRYMRDNKENKNKGRGLWTQAQSKGRIGDKGCVSRGAIRFTKEDMDTKTGQTKHKEVCEAGKTQKHSGAKTIKKSSEAQKVNTKDPPRQRRVFGTIQNPNVQAKTTIIGKPKTKILSGVVPKPTKAPSTEVSEIQEPKIDTNDEKKEKPKNKSVYFKEKTVPGKELQTPVKRLSVLAKPRVSGTPYVSAEKCSKCRFDKLETSSYWLAQIKLAESVKKHFVSATFFRLALESKAEPLRNIKVELKKYMVRHEELSVEKEWKEISVAYGLIKEMSNMKQENTPDVTNEEKHVVGEEQETPEEEVVEDNEAINIVES